MSLTLRSLLPKAASPVGLIVGGLFFAFALTPTLIPRDGLIQGLLGGVAFAAGYGIGTLLGGIWRFLELPQPGPKLWRVILWSAAMASVLVMVLFLSRAADWQDSIRAGMGLAPSDPDQPVILALMALLVAAVLVLLARLIGHLVQLALTWLKLVLPPRVAFIMAVALVGFLVGSVASGYLLRKVIRAVDLSAQAVDALIQPDLAAPVDPLMTGSMASLVSWKNLGSEGRFYIARTPTAGEIADVTGGTALRPIRVYAGLNSADDVDDRASLALAELIRVGGFERSVLVVAMPTGTGWMDPAAVEPLEYLHRGDVATVAMQYSYLQSWVSLLVQPEQSLAAGRALFTAIYSYWRQLPEETRPRLYLYGLSLGAYSSEQSIRPHELIDQPVDGALWVGPTFLNPFWRSLTAERDAGSPEWLPRLETSRTVQFSNGKDHPERASWGSLRIVYLQYASDPVSFFRETAALARPDWLSEPLGPDVSPEFRWYPLVTFLQLLTDMALAVRVPIGHGHAYHPSDHIRPWLAVTQPPGWDETGLAGLKAFFDAKAQMSSAQN